MLSWVFLIAAGLCEIVWALGLKYSNGLTKPFITIVTIVFMALSVYLLALAVKQIPLSISYTIWVGIGAMGAFLGGIFLFNEKVNTLQMIFFLAIMIGIIGLKMTSTKIS